MGFASRGLGPSLATEKIGVEMTLKKSDRHWQKKDGRFKRWLNKQPSWLRAIGEFVILIGTILHSIAMCAHI
jgi:hypothetical protein